MWGQSTLIISSLSPKRDWGPKRVNRCPASFYSWGAFWYRCDMHFHRISVRPTGLLDQTVDDDSYKYFASRVPNDSCTLLLFMYSRTASTELAGDYSSTRYRKWCTLSGVRCARYVVYRIATFDEPTAVNRNRVPSRPLVSPKVFSWVLNDDLRVSTYVFMRYTRYGIYRPSKPYRLYFTCKYLVYISVSYAIRFPFHIHHLSIFECKVYYNLWYTYRYRTQFDFRSISIIYQYFNAKYLIFCHQ